jgi:hypothetical protein
MHKVNDLSVRKAFFPLYVAISFQAHGNVQEKDLQSGILECKVYHNMVEETSSTQPDNITTIQYSNPPANRKNTIKMMKYGF